MQSDEWAENFNKAYEAYVRAQYSNALLTSKEREDAALEFIDWISHFKTGTISAREVLETELLSNDMMRRYAAGYILIEVAEPDRLAKLSETMTEVHNSILVLSHQVLKRLWTVAPPKNGRELFWRWIVNNNHARLPLLEALLAHPTAPAFDLYKEILSSGHSAVKSNGVANVLGDTVIRLISRWNQPELLRDIIDNPPLEPSLLHLHEDIDLRIEASLYLGLIGDQIAISFLETTARVQNQLQAAQACYHLSLLAQPTVIEKIKPLLVSEDGNVVATALDATSIIKAVDLIPDLLDLANKEVYSDIFPEPLCDDAIRIIGKIIIHRGSKELLQEEFVEETYGDFGGIYTETYRRQMIDYYRTISKAFKVGLRYQKGELLTLKHLAENLSSPHSGPFDSAAFNLPAITGQQYDIDLDSYRDRIANAKAILFWKEFAAHSAILKPGGWAYQGRPLDYPQSSEKSQ